MKESQIQSAILEYLQILENQGQCYCYRSASGAVPTATGRYFQTGKPGIPDITCCIKGKYIGFEVKVPKNKYKQSDNQKKAEEAIRKAQGKYYVVTSIADVEKILELIK